MESQFGNHTSAPHASPDYALGLCLTGLDAFRAPGYTGRVPAGSLLALEPGQIHCDTTRAGAIRMLYAPERLWGGPLTFAAPVVDDPTVWQAAMRLFEEADERAWAALVSVCESRPWVVRRRRPPTRFASLLARLAEQPVALETLAAQAGTSPSAFLRRFRDVVGCTPAEYSRQARLTRAAHALSHGEAAARAAADQEFYDQSHLARHFRRVYSVPPGEFQRRNSVQS